MSGGYGGLGVSYGGLGAVSAGYGAAGIGYGAGAVAGLGTGGSYSGLNYGAAPAPGASGYGAAPTAGMHSALAGQNPPVAANIPAPQNPVAGAQPGYGPGAAPASSGFEARLQQLETNVQNLNQSMTQIIKILQSQNPSANPPASGEKSSSFSELLKTLPAPARITVQLPANANLYVDNVRCTLTSSKRSFLTPQLVSGKRYFYTLRMETIRNGQRVQENRLIEVAAGEHVQINFDQSQLVTARR